MSEYPASVIAQDTFKRSNDLFRLNHHWKKINGWTCAATLIQTDTSISHSYKSCSKICDLDAACVAFQTTTSSVCKTYDQACLNPPNFVATPSESTFIKIRQTNLYYMNQHTWQQAHDQALLKGSRILTLEEARLELARSVGHAVWDQALFSTEPVRQVSSLVPVKDVWVAVGESAASKGWMYVGMHNPSGDRYPGKTLSSATCSDKPCDGHSIFSMIHSDRH